MTHEHTHNLRDAQESLLRFGSNIESQGRFDIVHLQQHVENNILEANWDNAKALLSELSATGKQLTNQFFLSVCGWTVETLMEKSDADNNTPEVILNEIASDDASPYDETQRFFLAYLAASESTRKEAAGALKQLANTDIEAFSQQILQTAQQLDAVH